jgi:hypothetical protein
MTVIEFTHDHLLPELLASTRLGEYILAELSPRAVAVNPDAIETICRELVRKGYTPRREG